MKKQKRPKHKKVYSIKKNEKSIKSAAENKTQNKKSKTNFILESKYANRGPHRAHFNYLTNLLPF